MLLGLEVRVADALHVAAAIDERLLGGGTVAGQLVGGGEVLILGGHPIVFLDESSKYTPLAECTSARCADYRP